MESSEFVKAMRAAGCVAELAELPSAKPCKAWTSTFALIDSISNTSEVLCTPRPPEIYYFRRFRSG